MSPEQPSVMPMPFVSMTVDQNLVTKLSEAWESWHAKGGGGMGSFGVLETDHSPKLDVLVQEIIKNNKPEEVLALFYASFATKASWHQTLEWRVVENLKDWVVRWAINGDGSWNDLIDHATVGLGLKEFVPESMATKWREWAIQIPVGPERGELLNPVFNFKSAIPLSLVAQYIKEPSTEFMEKTLIKINKQSRKLTEGLLNRSDLTETQRHEVTRGLLTKANLEEPGPYPRPGIIFQIATFEKWCPPEMGEMLLARAKNYPKPKTGLRPLASLRNWPLRTLSRLANGNTKYWREVVSFLGSQKDPDEQKLTEALGNPGFSATVAKKLLQGKLAGEDRKVISANYNLVKNKSIRTLLEHSGQDAAVWTNLLRTSDDPEEASRLISYLSQTNLAQAIKALNAITLPEGTTLPKSVLASMIKGASTTTKSERVALIAKLPTVKLQDTEAPVVPKRAKSSKRKG